MTCKVKCIPKDQVNKARLILSDVLTELFYLKEQIVDIEFSIQEKIKCLQEK